MVQFVPMSAAAPVRYRRGPDPALVNLELLKETLGAVGDVGGILKQQAANQALADVLQGKPGRPAIPPTAGGAVEPGTGRVSLPDPGRAATAGTALLPPELLPIAQRLALSGDHDAAVKMVTDYQASIRPEPISPYQQARLAQDDRRLDLAQQGQTETLELKREQFDSDRAFKQAELALKDRELDIDAEATGVAKRSDLSSFRSQYTGLSEDFIKIRDAYGKLRSAVENPSAAGDLSLIFSYMKILDPGSTVREGEQASAQNTTGAAGRIAGLYNRVVSGERLTPEQRADFAAQSHNLFQSQLEQQEMLQQSFSDTAQRLFPRFSPGDSVPDFVGKSREWTALGVQPAGPGRVSEADVAGATQQLLGQLPNMTGEQLDALDTSVMTEEQLRAMDARERQLGIN